MDGPLTVMICPMESENRIQSGMYVMALLMPRRTRRRRCCCWLGFGCGVWLLVVVVVIERMGERRECRRLWMMRLVVVVLAVMV